MYDIEYSIVFGLCYEERAGEVYLGDSTLLSFLEWELGITKLDEIDEFDDDYILSEDFKKVLAFTILRGIMGNEERGIIMMRFVDDKPTFNELFNYLSTLYLISECKNATTDDLKNLEL